LTTGKRNGWAQVVLMSRRSHCSVAVLSELKHVPFKADVWLDIKDSNPLIPIAISSYNYLHVIFFLGAAGLR
jgi:hypothetical protein